MILRICDFFSGLHSWTKPLENSSVARRVFSVDNNPDYAHNTTLIMDFLQLTPEMIIQHLGGKPHVILASPPCTTFSIASCSTHWFPPAADGSRKPKSEAAKIGLKLLEHLLYLIKELDCIYFFENPRGLMRKMDCVQDLNRHTVWYCQYYSESCPIKRAKPTDIWTNSKVWIPRPECKNGNPDCDHVRARRGAKTGTQGLKGNAERSVIPHELCREIMDSYLKELGV